MLNIAICEDDKVDREKLRVYIEEVLKQKSEKGIIEGYSIYQYSNAEEMQLTLENIRYDIVFLDMYMDQMTGIELAKQLREIDKKVLIIFVTSSSEFAIEGYTVRAFHYLLKPLTKMMTAEIVKSAINHRLETEGRYFLFPTEKDLVKINLNDVYFIECTTRKTLVRTKDDRFICNYSINAMEEKLENMGFVRCHRSFIIHLKYIKSFKQSIIVMENGEEVFLSKYKQKEVKEKLHEYLGGQI